MGRSPCCDKVGLKKGPWTPEEDQKLLAYIEEHGHGSWRALPAKAGLQRCGKSCRLRWTNYLRPDIKRGKFTLQEEQTIIQLHALLGNRWSAIATHLPKRTDNEIKNYWNTHLKKRLTKMGIDPVTHKPKNDALLSSDGQSNNKSAANLSHMAQWESARLEAEARLVRESKLRSHNNNGSSSSLLQHQIASSSSANSTNSAPILKAWNTNNGGWLKSNELGNGLSGDLELGSPTSTLSFSENNNVVPPIMANTMPMIEFVGTTSGNSSNVKEEGYDHQSSMTNVTSSLHELTMTMDGTTWSTTSESLIRTSGDAIAEEGFTNLLLNANSDDRSFCETEVEIEAEIGTESNNNDDGTGGDGSDFYEDNKNYWNSILNLVNSSPSDSLMF